MYMAQALATIPLYRPLQDLVVVSCTGSHPLPPDMFKCLQLGLTVQGPPPLDMFKLLKY